MLLLVFPTDAQLQRSQDLCQLIGTLGASPTFPSLLSATCHIFSDSQASLFLFLWLESCLVWFYVLILVLFCFAFGVLATCTGRCAQLELLLEQTRAPFPVPPTRVSLWNFLPAPTAQFHSEAAFDQGTKVKEGEIIRKLNVVRVISPVWSFSPDLFAVVNFPSFSGSCLVLAFCPKYLAVIAEKDKV